MRALYAGDGTDDGVPMDRAIAQVDPVPRVSIQVFCESPDIAATVSAAISDRRMAKAHIKLNMGGGPAAVEAYKSAPTPNVVVLEAPAGRDALLEQLEELAQYCDAGTKMVVLGKLNDIVLYRQLIARGVSEYLVAPFGVVDFVQAMSQLFSVPGAKPLGRVIAVVGAKGGVGASTVAHNLAWSLASVTEMATIIADFDLAFGTAGLDYNQDPPQGVAEAVFAPERVDAVLVDRLLSKCGDHLSLLAAPATLDRASTLPRSRSIRCSTPCGRQHRGSWSMCRTYGRAGPDGSSSPRTRSS
jgi:pilus assembly protein CpaE